jgi:ActR/RegA family two-component response regulator
VAETAGDQPAELVLAVRGDAQRIDHEPQRGAGGEQEVKKGRRPAAVFTDLKMPRLDGLGLLERLQSRPSPPPVVIISGHGDISTAVEAVKKGAVNFLEKPLEENRVLVTLRGILREDRLTVENQRLKQKLSERWQIVGESPAIQRLSNQIAQVAGSVPRSTGKCNQTLNTQCSFLEPGADHDLSRHSADAGPSRRTAGPAPGVSLTGRRSRTTSRRSTTRCSSRDSGINLKRARPCCRNAAPSTAS